MFLNTIFSVLGGLGLFVYGIFMMGEGLQKAAGDRMRGLLRILTSNPLAAVFVGAGVTSLVQSSTATTVLLVGFVNAGLMTLKQALGVIFGANIGTTITAQIVAFKFTDLALPAIAIGAVLHLFCKKRYLKNIGLFILGFGILFLGLKIMTAQVKTFSDDPTVKQLFINLSRNMFLGVFVGMVSTAFFQSSSITTSLVVTLASLGLIDINASIYLILGCNIGTCITAVLASIKTSVSARRTALGHVLFNVFGTIVAFLLLPVYRNIILSTSSDVARQCANFHTLFNVANAVIFLPFIGFFNNLVIKIIPGKDIEEELAPRYLEKHLLNTPAIAFQASVKEAVHMAIISKQMVTDAMSAFFSKDRSSLDVVDKEEAAVDRLQEAISEYLVELTQRELSAEVSRKIPSLLHSINDIERIGDHAENLVELAERRIDANMHFSHYAFEEIKAMYEQVMKMFDSAIGALENNDTNQARLVLEIEKTINEMTVQYKQSHIMRLNEGKCKLLSGIVFLDTVNNFEKIGDHLTNVGQAVMGHLQWHSRELVGSSSNR